MKKLDNKWAGAIIGIVLPLILVWGVIFILAQSGGYPYKVMLDRFFNVLSSQGKMISLSIIGNLGIFYLFLRKNWSHGAMGIILGTLAYIPYVIYVNFIA